MGASVKVMLSYDYCHFEVCKSTDEQLPDTAIDDMRKDVQRLANKAVVQYQIYKRMEMIRNTRKSEREQQGREVERIEAKPEGTRTLDEVAKVKAYHDRNWDEYISAKYDFEDDYEGFDDDDE